MILRFSSFQLIVRRKPKLDEIEKATNFKETFEMRDILVSDLICLYKLVLNIETPQQFIGSL